MNWLQPHYNKKPPTAGKNKNAVASSGPKTHPPQENIWFGFRQTQQKMTATPSNLEKSIILEHFYRNARTHFSKNQQIALSGDNSEKISMMVCLYDHARTYFTTKGWKQELKHRRLPAEGWPAPPALTFTDFLNFPPPNFFFELGKSQVCRVGCPQGQKRRGSVARCTQLAGLVRRTQQNI